MKELFDPLLMTVDPDITGPQTGSGHLNNGDDPIDPGDDDDLLEP